MSFEIFSILEDSMILKCLKADLSKTKELLPWDRCLVETATK